ncbi:Hydantoinase/oxoprolinase-domain-containing protein [Lentinula lateritia]|nr:Hydantoinase/oxoprolinase-domain-containing protein [Lentinula lateritia]
MAPTLRIGVDVGGTNTDACLINPFATTLPNRGILSWHKSVTTPNPSHGIENVINALIKQANVDAGDIASITIGTTHFINAVIEKDSSRLAPVAVLRLCGPFSRSIPPGIDWPADLREIICAHVAYLDGGLEIDGSVIRDPSEAQVKEECTRILSLGIRSIVVNGIFSPADVLGERQEEKVGEWIKSYYPEADVVLSKEVANLGFIERENAAMLNASILPFARHTISSFQFAIYHRLKLSCPVFLTQNDGTILKAEDAARLPIRTFNSGPTNSMCGAAFLVKENVEKECMLVVDIGGTTTDVGMLLASGLPRQASAFTEIAGVRLNFSCPDVKSIGLGGGSIVRIQGDSLGKPTLSIGPDSVGHLINKHALVFSGDIPTATDYAVASQENLQTSIGARQLAVDRLHQVVESKEYSLPELLTAYQTTAKRKLEEVIDRMKTSAENVPVLLVGGGAIIIQSHSNDGKVTLKGASKVITPEYAGVANAIGAAMARVSGMVDTVLNTEGRTTQSVLQEVSKTAIERTVTAGAVRDTVEIAEMDAIPIPYVANKCRMMVKAVGDFDFSRVSNTTPASLDLKVSSVTEYSEKKISTKALTTVDSPRSTVDAASYIPTISSNYEWHLSELDLEWISVGCYILGTGGGGTPYPHFVRLREMIRSGATVTIVEPGWVGDEDIVACGGAKGSPTVSLEKPPGNE